MARLTFLCIGFFFACLVLTSISNAYLKMGNVVAIWLLDEGEGEVVTDASGNGNDGVFASGNPKWVKGKFGKALKFDGVDDWVEMNAPVVVDGLNIGFLSYSR